MSHSAPDDPAWPLENVVDDSDARDQAGDWAYSEIAGGRSLEEVVADLTSNGWSHDDAEGIAEQARHRTRSRRGVTTGQDARQAYGVGDPRVVRDATPFANPSQAGALGGLVRAISRLWSTRNVGRSDARAPKK